MSLKLLKSQENTLVNPSQDKPSNEPQQRRFQSKWNFNLHTTRPRLKLRRQVQKKLVLKYYGKKVLYLTEPKEAKALISHSKLLKYIEADQNFFYNNLKSKGNLVVLNGSLGVYSLDYRLQSSKWLLLKKILKNCEKAEISIYCGPEITLLKYLLSLTYLSIKTDRNFGLSSLGSFLGNLLNLERIKVNTTQSGHWGSVSKKSKNKFFAPLHKISRLKRVDLTTDDQEIQETTLEKDLERFYRKPHNFKLSINIKVENNLRKKLKPSFVKILNEAEFLTINDGDDFGDEETMNIPKEEKERINLVKNIVKIRNDSNWTKLNVARILSCCGSLEYLHITEDRNKIIWNSSPDQEEIKGFKNLKIVSLKFKNLSIDSEDELSGSEGSEDEKGNNFDSKRNFSSSLFEIFSQIKEKYLSLQHLSLNLNGVFEQKLRLTPGQKSLFAKSLKKFAQEISTFDKLKTFALLINPDHLKLLPPSQILSNPGLESFHLEFTSNGPSSDLNWDSYFAKIEQKSQVKELKITIPAERKIHLFGINFLNFIRRLDNLEIVELIDGSLELVTFDFLYGFVTSLLEKENIRKILICTKVINTFFTESSGMVLSKRVEADLQNMLKTISEELEGLVENLKGRQLEEIFVRKLQGYSFNYLFYNKEMKVTEKLFWTQKEMDRLLYENEELERRYEGIFKLFEN